MEKTTQPFVFRVSVLGIQSVRSGQAKVVAAKQNVLRKAVDLRTLMGSVFNAFIGRFLCRARAITRNNGPYSFTPFWKTSPMCLAENRRHDGSDG
jgi:hypothetical protein